jgi:hypothetical protein
MRRWVILALPLAFACAEALPEHIDLTPQAETVEFAMEPPSPDAYKLLGKVVGVAAGKDVDAAQEAAKNDLRNKAAALGASLVTIDENLGEPMPLADKTRVKLVGRAYKSVD